MPHDRERFLVREVYFVLIPAAIFAVIAGLAYAELGRSASRFDRLLLPAMAALLSGMWILLWRKPDRLREVEYGFIASAGAFFVVRMIFAMYVLSPATQLPIELTEFVFWFPAYYGLVFLVFGIERGKRVAWGVFAISVLIAGPWLPNALASPPATQSLYALTQLYLSSALMIFILDVLGRRLVRLTREASEMTTVANTDPLTTLGNRRALMTTLADEIARARRYDTEFSILMIDLDRFKQINDRYGHMAGDAVLASFGELLAHESRDTDLAGRWGGEEFMVVLPETGQATAERTARRLRRAVEDRDFAGIGEVTISVGVATFATADSLDNLVHRADEALYRAKDRGRNRVEVAGREAT